MSHAEAFDAIPPELGGGPGEELAYRLAQQKVLSDFGVLALRCRDLDTLLQAAARLCADGLATRFCKAMEFLPAENRFLVRAGVGWHDGVVGWATIGADLESPAGYAFATGKPVISNHLAEETRFRTPRLLAEHGIKRAINVVIAGGPDVAPFGVLEADSALDGRFEEADLAFMQGFASLLGVAVERQRADDERRRSEDRLREVLEHAPQKMWLNAADGTVLSFNKAWRDYTGQSTAPEGLAWAEAVHPDDRGRMVDARTRAISRGEPYDVALRLRRAEDGAYRWHVGSVKPLGEAGRPNGWIGTATDVHDMREAQAELAAERARLDAVFRTVPVGLVIAEAPSGRIVSGNPQTELILGHPVLPSANVEAYGEWRARHPDGRRLGAFEYPLARALREKRLTPVEEYLYDRPDGTRGWIRLQAAPIIDGDGAVTAAVVAVVDIDGQKRAEGALRVAEERYRLAARATKDAIWDWDVAAGTVGWNEAVQDLFGYPLADVPGTPEWWQGNVHPKDRPRVLASRDEALTGPGEHWSCAYRFRRADGGYAHVVDRGSIIRDGSGRPSRMVGGMHDVTEQRRSEERQALLAQELQHRVKNTLAMVQAMAGQTFRPETPLADARAAFAGRLVALGRAHDLLTRSDWTASSVRAVVENALAPHDLPRIDASGGDIGLGASAALALTLVLHELATNAVKYGALSNDRGRVEIAWDVLHTSEGPILRLTWMERGGPPVEVPRRIGFGSRLIERSLGALPGARVGAEYLASGVVWTIEAPLTSLGGEEGLPDPRERRADGALVHEGDAELRDGSGT